ncbi:MAG: phosphotransferase [Candidatus Limnocylindrales bacterium]
MRGADADWTGRTDELLAMRLPDWRPAALTEAIADLFERRGAEVAPADRETLRAFIGGLDARFAVVAACGIPDTLVHGDFHPGDVRGEAEALRILDWGDTGVGSPGRHLPAVRGQYRARRTSPSRC